MNKKVYALLVAIDNYPQPIPSLQGCANDIRDFKAYLEGRIDVGSSQLSDVLDIRALMNETATRTAVIREFREHLW